MKVHKAKLLNTIQYIGDEPRVVRELLTNPLPTVEKGDILIVPEKVARFLSRLGSPFEMFEMEEFANTGDGFTEQIADDAVAKVTKLNQTILELEQELKLKIDELEAYELRENQEMEELKELNAKLNEELEEKSTTKTTTKKTTTKAAKEETL